MNLEGTEWDYIVVGAGSAGCVVANRLSANPANRVLLLEAGGSDRSVFIQMPAATYIKGIGNPRFDWMYRTEPDPSVGGRSDTWPRGKVMGGSSSINGMLYIRGFPSDYDGWAAAGNPGWGWKDVLPLFLRHEDNVRGASEFHGKGGELTVSDLERPHPVAALFGEAARRCGHPWLDDLNGASRRGFGYVQATQRRGWRCSAAKAFIDPVRRRPNLCVAPSTVAQRILFDGGRAVGVEVVARGRQARLRLRGEIIVSAGAIASPHLLLNSGIGEAATLARFGIPVVADRPEVGRNLQDHPGLGMTWATSLPTYNDEMRLWKQVLHGANWLLRGRGAGTTPDAHIIGFLASSQSESVPDIQVHVTPAGYLVAGDGDLLLRQSSFTTVVSVCRPGSRGRITKGSADPLAPPRIENRVLSDAGDMARLARGIREVHRILASEPLRGVVRGPITPAWADPPDNILHDYLRRHAGSIYHPAGTCRMGPDDGAVVDPRLRLKGVAGVRVADASIMPAVTSGNLNAPCMMIGEKAAALVLGQA